MDVMSSSFAVIALAVQLLETTQKIRSFLHDVRDAPKEIIRLTELLDQLHGTLDHVKSLLEQQYLVLRLPGSPVHMLRALVTCEKTMQRLESLVKKAKESFGHQQRMKRTWASMIFASNRETIQELQDQLRDAKADLQGAISSNTWQLQMHTVHLASHSLTRIPDLAQDQPVSTEPIQVSGANLSKEPSVFPNPRKTPRTTTNTKRTLWYRGILGAVIVDTESRYICQDRKAIRKSRTAMSEKTIILVTPTFLTRQLEICFTTTFGSIARTMQTYPVVASLRDLEAESCIAAGDLEALQLMFSSGAVSPFVLSEEGETLLHLAAQFSRPEICAFLIQLGVDADRMNTDGWKAIHTGGDYSRLDDKRYLDTFRVLAQAQNDFTENDVNRLVFWYTDFTSAPIEVVHSILSLDSVQYHMSQGPEDDTTMPILAESLFWFTYKPSGFEPFVREILRKGADIHVRVPREDQTPRKSERRLPRGVYGTPLDELWASASTPFEAIEIADRWLQLLLSEGRDIRKYVEKERDLHVNDEFFTWPSQAYHDIDARVLRFDLGNSPRVWWEWYIDPSASIPELRQELDHIAMLHLSYRYPVITWKDMWPYEYPPWFEYFEPWDNRDEEYLQKRQEWKRVNKLFHERTNRREKKKAAKAARAQGLKTKQSQMPGAWPT